MAHSVNYHVAGLLNVKQDPVISHPQSVSGGEGRQTFHVSGEVVFQYLQCINNPCHIGFGKLAQILPGARLQFDFISDDL